MKYVKLFSFLILATFFGASESMAQKARLGEIRIFAGNYAPAGWKMCNGEELEIASNGQLFSLIKTTYGGDGRTTFALPDLRGRAVIGSSPTLKPGEKVGNPQFQIWGAYMPELTVPVHSADINDPLVPGHKAMLSSDMEPSSISILNEGSDSGQQKAISTYQPYLGINYIICVDGLFYSN